MSEYQVLARRYRPQKFADVVSQAPIVSTLKNAIQMGRTAHAYLFCGCRGTGKTTLARLFAKVLNCYSLSDEAEPCNSCPSCRDIALGHAIDVLEIDGASHRGIEDVRQINETIGFTPVGGKYKIYLIDEVHMLTKEAFNALLKTLEEPPPHVKFFFCTTEPHKIPATILSRCQRFNLQRIPLEKIAHHLAHICQAAGVAVDPDALTLVAQRADGSMRDALSLFDQIIAFEKGTITVHTVTEILGLPSKETCFALDEAILHNDIAALFRISAELFAAGQNLSYFLEELTAHFRALLLVKCGHSTQNSDKKYEDAARAYRPEQLIQILEMLTDGQQTLKSASSERTALEMLLLKILRTQQQLSLETLVQRLISMEKRLSFSEDPVPKATDLPCPKISKPEPKSSPKPAPKFEPKIEKTPSTPAKQLLAPPPVEQEAPRFVGDPNTSPLSIQEQSRFDTVMRFAAKELNGSIKK